MQCEDYMIYISIPKGMEFKQITNDIETRDFFVDPQGKLPQIDLQELVKEALRHNSGRLKTIELKEFSIYTRVPPKVGDYFLKYVPNNNGKLATKDPVTLVMGVTEQKFQPQSHTRYGMFWDQTLYLDPERKKEILDKRMEQKHNRRHDGDSPKST